MDYSTSNSSAKDNDEQSAAIDSSTAQPDAPPSDVYPADAHPPDAHPPDTAQPGTESPEAPSSDMMPSPPILSLEGAVEALLFVADSPVSVGRLAEALQVTPGQVERALDDLEATYAERGLRLQRAGSRVQLITAPQVAPAIERFLGLEARTYLSRAALETLAIIVYRQPITRPEIETIRGVGSDSVLRTLLRYGLIDEVGRAPTVGHPILYGTTFEFLQHFGLRSLEEMPPLEEEPTDDEANDVEANDVDAQGV